VCDIPSLKSSAPPTKTNFVTCYEVYTVADYFALAPLAKIALDTLAAEFDARLGPNQLQYESAAEWLPELCEAIRLVYADTPLPDANLTPIRRAFVSFVHTARFYFLQDAEFNRFLDEEAPGLALDLFRAMRATGDFVAHLPDACCSFCKMKPTTRGDKAYYTHLAPDTLRLTACCSTCAAKKDLGSGMANWAGKRGPAGA
jgi:hypothetical protein